MTVEEIEGLLPKMNEAGLSWLTPILRSMLGGDPFQEGMYAKEIVGAWVQSGHAEDVEIKRDALDAYARQNADLHRENIRLRDENAKPCRNERQRIIALAETHNAFVAESTHVDGIGDTLTMKPFADLLREEARYGHP